MHKDSEISSAYRASLIGENIRFFVAFSSFNVKKSIEIDPKSEEISSLDYFALSVLSEMMLCLKNAFVIENITLYDFEAKIKIDFKNSLFAFGVRGFNEPCKISNIRIRFYVNSNLTDSSNLCREAVQRSILYQSLKDAINFEFSFCDIC